MPFVLDASVALAWCFRDEQNAYAHRMLRRLDDESAVVPNIWLLEVANGLLIAERRGRLSRAEAAQVGGVLADLPITWQETSIEQALGSVLELGEAHGLSAYDAAYLDLAMRDGLPLATQDKALRAAAEQVGVLLVD
jgi:predicted nucleic acid-binding protein